MKDTDTLPTYAVVKVAKGLEQVQFCTCLI